ncbi:DEKNAAC101943 [Brettanomyces naardenensis]|uniref:DEKNAAC101943 n=1 Tax=Brettanomyces naardenensis TaxID=13370 RepID=A0A448YJP0_BRENA|nr:DEKNAAC101943 [Brettanomyces naardenensis]
MSAAQRTLGFLKDVFIPVPPVKAIGTAEKFTGISEGDSIGSSVPEFFDEKKKGVEYTVAEANAEDVTKEFEEYSQGHTHRMLSNRQLQLIALSGTLGVGMFVNTSKTLTLCGPLSLVLGCIFWSIPVLIVNISCGEMVVHLPIPSPFISLAERCIDEAFGFMAGWNFWVLQGSLVPFEMTLFNSLIHYWRDDFSAAIPFALILVLYFFINLSNVKYYGEFEFYLGMTKIILAIGMILFVFFTMLGANPLHDRYGFRYWETPMVEYIGTGANGRFQGFLASVIAYTFLIAGPEYISMCASEVKNPRAVLPNAYKSVFYRIAIFFVGCAIATGTCVSYDNATLLAAINNGAPGAGSCAFTVAMKNLNIKVLPDIVNVVLMLASLSGGNSFVYCTSRTLYGMAIDGKAPRFFSHCNKGGVPIYSVLAALCWGCLSFLQLGEGASVVLSWIINLVTASQLLNYMIILAVYLQFLKCLKAQGIDREDFIFKGWWQPYQAWFGIFIIICMLGAQGYYVFLPDSWNVPSFLFSYIMIFIDVGLFVGWKVIKRTKFISPHEADLVTGMDEVNAHERYLESIGELKPMAKKSWKGKIVNLFFGF